MAVFIANGTIYFYKIYIFNYTQQSSGYVTLPVQDIHREALLRFTVSKLCRNYGLGCCVQI